MKRPIMLDLFCGGGGAAKGYHDAGFRVIGVDSKPQPHYPYPFVQADALEFLDKYGYQYDAIHASPPCQGYSRMKSIHGKEYPQMIAEVRDALQASGKPYVIENVVDAKPFMDNPITLCGTMFGLLVIRHRCFESNIPLSTIPLRCNHLRPVVKCGRKPDREKHYAAVYGHFSDVEFGQMAMDIDWLGQKGLAQAIPPAYTMWVGQQIIRSI